MPSEPEKKDPIDVFLEMLEQNKTELGGVPQRRYSFDKRTPW